MELTKQINTAPAPSVPVRITLACGWCSRRLDDLAGEMSTGSGRMQVTSAPGRFRLLSGRPVCPECGGPLFVDDWHTIRPRTEPDFNGPDDADDEASDLAAA
jgi:hypothetical protein